MIESPRHTFSQVAIIANEAQRAIARQWGIRLPGYQPKKPQPALYDFGALPGPKPVATGPALTVRMAIMARLVDGPATVEDLATGMDPAAVAAHLSAARRAKLVSMDPASTGNGPAATRWRLTRAGRQLMAKAAAKLPQ